MPQVADIISAFSSDHVVRLTGLTKGQLSYWDKTGFFSPQFASEQRKEPYSRIYSFRDVVGLRTLAVLRNKHRISLQRLRKFAGSLDGRDSTLWSGLRLYVLNQDVYFSDEAADIGRNAEGQNAPVVFMQNIINDAANEVAKLKKRSSDQFGRIERHRFTMRNAPVIAGTRIPIASIKRFSEAGYSVAEILKEYPTLTEKDVRAALREREGLAKSA